MELEFQDPPELPLPNQFWDDKSIHKMTFEI